MVIDKNYNVLLANDYAMKHNDGLRMEAIGKGRDALATLDRIIADHIPDASKMVVPDGYALVPIEPTYEMVKAAWRYQYLHVGATAVEADLLSENRSNNKEQFEMDCNAYKAMLSVAPEYKGEPLPELS